jgi:hypothetical protein
MSNLKKWETLDMQKIKIIAVASLEYWNSGILVKKRKT